VCAGTNGVIYEVAEIANAITYEWTLPAGAVITTGAGTNEISVSFSTTPGNGIITVTGNNVCGSGAISPDYPVTMVESQAAPVITPIGALLTSSIADGNQWYYEGIGAIAGATGQTYTATITGWYWSIVKGVGCPSLESNHVYILFTGEQEALSTIFNVYPVPSDGKFNVSITSPFLENYTILVYNAIGMKIFQRDDIPVKGTFEHQINISPIVNGMYTVVFLHSNHSVVRKVLVK
jgi:hypothetical protein